MVPGMAPGMGTRTDTGTGTVPDMKQLLILRVLVLVQVSVCTSMGNRREPGQISNDTGTLQVSILLVTSPV